MSCSCSYKTSYLLMMHPSGAMYSLKRMGPYSDPWGTPQVKGWVNDLACPMEMNSDLSVRYDLNRPVPVNSVKCCRWWRRIWWSTVSKGADRERRNRGQQWSTGHLWPVRSRLCCCSVLCVEWRPDWNLSRIWLCCRCPWRWHLSPTKISTLALLLDNSNVASNCKQ